MSRLERGEKLLKTLLVCGGSCAFDGSTLLASDDASSSVIEWRSNLLIWGSGDGESDARSISMGDVCNVDILVSVSTFKDKRPLPLP